MKRFHVHVAVNDLEKSIRFYKAMFDAEPTVVRADYAKWQRGAKTGVDHLGIQAEDGAELARLRSQLAQADVAIMDQKNATCCYAKSDKHWTIDPQGIAWESFHTLDGAPRYGEDTRIEVREAKAACCAPTAA